MTETLTRLLHDRADDVRFDPIDLDAIARTATRVARRRRWGAGAGAAAAAVALASLTVLPWSHGPSAPADGGSTTAGITWASGTVLHTPGGDLELGHEVAAYVRTSVGYVFTDGQDVYSYARHEVSAVGRLRNPAPLPGWPTLAADPAGTLAAWPDGSDYVVLDQQTGALSRVFATAYPHLVGVDAGSLYVTNDQDSFTIDVDSGAVHPVDDLNSQDLTLLAARGGTVLALDGEGRLVRDPDGRQVLLPAPVPDSVSLSPDGLRAVEGYRQASGPVQSLDLRTGAHTRLPLDDAFTAYPYEWLDDDTLALLSLPTAHDHYQLLTCEVDVPTCEVAVPDLGEGRDDGGNGVGFVLPIGEPYFPYPHG